MSWSGVDRWTRADERAWLCTLAPATLARYLGTLSQRTVDFHGHPITADFLEDCRYDHARAVARQAADTGPQEDIPPRPGGVVACA